LYPPPLCEIIDNSLGHGEAKNIQINFKWNEKHAKSDPDRFDEVFIADDGLGMDDNLLSKAIQLGASATFNQRNTIGRFGIGLIAGTISQCQTAEIYTKRKEDDDWYYIRFNVLEVAKGVATLAPIIKPPPEKYTSIIKDSGTIVIWSMFDYSDNFDQDWEPHNKGGGYKGDLGYLFYDLGRIYRKFISEEIAVTKNKKSAVVKNDNLRVITLNGKKLIPCDPLYVTKIPGFEKDPKAEFLEELELQIPVHPNDQKVTKKDFDFIQIRMTLLPKEWRLATESDNPFLKQLYPRFVHWNTGISVLRNSREISYNHIPFVGPQEQPWDRYWGCEIEFPATLDKRFSVKNVKIGSRPDRDLTNRLDKYLSGPIAECVRRIRDVWSETEAKETVTSTSDSHDAATKRFDETGTGTDVIPGEITEEEKKKVREELAERFREHGKEVDPEKFDEIGVQFHDDTGLPESGSFLEIRNNLGTNIVIYNLKHQFFIHLDKIYQKLQELSDIDDKDELLERKEELKKEIGKARYLIDLLLGSFASAKGSLDPDAKQQVSSTLNHLISRWTESLFTVCNDKNFDKRINGQI